MKKHERLRLIETELKTEGKGAEIIKKFFLLGTTWPEYYTLTQILEEQFDVDNREISFYIAKESFRLKNALHWLEDGPKIQGLGSPIIKPKTLVLVRKDARHPKQVDIQFNGGQGNKDKSFSISIEEWQRIEPKLKRRKG